MVQVQAYCIWEIDCLVSYSAGKNEGLWKIMLNVSYQAIPKPLTHPFMPPTIQTEKQDTFFSIFLCI